jgi:hypothetical protein
VVARIAELLQLVDDRDGVIRHDAGDVDDAEPQVRALLPVIRRHVLLFRVVEHVLVDDVLEVCDVQRTVVGEVEVCLDAMLDLLLDRHDLVVVRQLRRLAVRGPELGPPDVDVLVVRVAGGVAVRPVEQDADVLVERVGRVGRVPDGEKMATGHPSDGGYGSRIMIGDLVGGFHRRSYRGRMADPRCAFYAVVVQCLPFTVINSSAPSRRSAFGERTELFSERLIDELRRG